MRLVVGELIFMQILGLLTIILVALTGFSFGQKVDEQKLVGLINNAQKYKVEASNLIKKGKYTEASDAYTKAIEPFLELTNLAEIALTEESIYLLYSLRAVAFMAAKEHEKAVKDFQAEINFYLSRAKKTYQKSKATPKPSEADLIKIFETSTADILQIYKTQRNYLTLYNNIFKANPSKMLLEESELVGVETVFSDILLDWGKVDTAIFLRTNNAANAKRALDNLGGFIQGNPKSVEGYKLREGIYRKQGNIQLANADKAKIKDLQ